MKKMKRIIKRFSAIVMASVLTLGMTEGITMPVKAADAILVSGSTGYFYVKVVNDTTGDTDTLRVNVTAKSKSGNKLSAGDETSTSDKVTYAGSVTNPKLGLKLNATQTHKNIVTSQDGTVSLLLCDLQFSVPAHTSYVKVEKNNRNNHTFRLADKVKTPITSGSYTDVTVAHNSNSYTKNMIMALNLYECGLRKGNKDVHSTITLHIKRNSYKISYNLDGGKFKNGNNTTYTNPSNGRTQKQNPTTALDGGEKNPYSNAYFYVENPTKKGYTFKGWNITGMDNDTHYFYTSGGAKTTTGTALNTTTNADAMKSSYIPTSYMNLRATSGTVTFNALFDVNRYNIIYDGNGATAGTMANQEHKYDAALNLTQNAYIRTGHTFLGWSRNKDAAEPEFLNGESVKNLTTDADGKVTLYAVWVKNSSALNNANILKNIKKIMKVNVVKTDETDDKKTLDATFDVYEWSKDLNNGYGAYKNTPSFSIKSNEENIFNYTADNLGKFKIKESYVEAPYINNGDEAEISLKDGLDMPFYENTMVEEDKGVFVMGAGYKKGDIVRDSAEKTGASYYMAVVSNVGKKLSDNNYWLKLNEDNYSKYKRLIKGAGEWNVAETYAKTFGIKIGNPSGSTKNGLVFSLRKKDERGSLLTGAGFNVYYADDGSLCRALNANPDKKGVYASNYDKNGTVLIDDEGILIDNSQIHATLNIDGTRTLELIVKEDKVPDNYGKIKDFKVKAVSRYNSVTNRWEVESISAIFSDGKTVSIANGGTIDTEELVDESYRLNISVTKQSKKQNYSVADLEGAEYTIYEDSTLSLPVTTIIIGRNGKGAAENLPLKDYWIKETKAPKSGKFLFSDEVKQVRAEDIATGSGTTTFNATVTFEEDEDSARLNVHKVDDRGNDLNGAEFTLYEYPADVTDKNIDDYDYSNVKSHGTEKVVNGYASFEDIPFGKYVLVETKVPDGYKKAPNQMVELTTENGGNSDVTAKTITVVNEEEKARIKLYKEDSADNDRIEGAVFKIFDVNNNSYIMQDVSGTDDEGNDIISQEERLFVTDENGLIKTEELTYGTYRIEEVEAPDGYVRDDTPRTVNLEKGKEDGVDEDGIPYFKVTFENKKTETWIDKTDITTGEELTGGEYTVTDLNGNTVDHWIGDGKTHKIYGLKAGEKYTLTEEVAPDGYTIATPIEFTVNEDGSVTKVEMKDDYNKLELKKCDITTREEIEGAEMELYDSEDRLIDSWVSGKTPHRIDRIKKGTYRLVEKRAPKGYVVAESITFEVGESNEVQEVVMNDDYTKTRFIKLATDTGEPLKGCVLQVLDKDRNVVEQWTTDGSEHEIDYLVEGETYYLHEVSAPDDYQKAEDIEFVAGRQWNDGNGVTEDDYNRMDGTQFTDQGGNTVNWDDGKVPTNEPADDLEPETGSDDDITNPDDGDGVVDEVDRNGETGDAYDASAAETVTITMLDKPKLVSIIKKTGSGDLLPGARLQLLGESGNVLYSWTTGADTSSVFRLGNGKYRIHEEYAPENYELAKDIEFEVTDDTTEVEYVMTDEYTGGSIKVLKTDGDTGKQLEGAEFTLKGENGLTLTGKTDKNGELVFGVRDGEKILPPQKYTLTETKTVNGHSLLKEPVEITLPLKLTKAEADAMGADTSKAKWDEENEVYRFFDLTYEVKNDAKLKLPATGAQGMIYGIAGAVIMIVLTLLYLFIKGKKRRRRIS